jgi:nicotinamide mononucleotide adenylyltransferase
MKSFFQFLNEAQTNAAKQAKKLGLKGDGHGSWLDSQNRIVGRTVEGELVFTSGRKPAQESDPTRPGPAARGTLPDQPPPPAPGQGGMQPEQGEVEEVEKTRGTLTIGFGRFNPPTSGHEKLLDTIKDTAAGEQYIVYPSHSVDPQKNPLDSETKVLFMKKMFPDHANAIVYDPAIRTIFDALKQADVEGYSGINIVVGADRQKEFENLANKYNGQLYNFDAINVISAGERDPDAEGVEGMSASKLRALAADGDYESFRKGLPKAAKGVVARELFNTVQRSMATAATTEGIELWQIAPKYDSKTLRENYVYGNIFGMGSLVESLNTGLVGRIIRRGANHVIAVTKEGIMFKSWIKDLTEYVSRIPSGVPASKREIGTDSYREYVQSLTPLEKVRSFINKR